MPKRFFLFLIAGILILGGAIFAVFSSTKGAHLRLDGSVLKVRTGKLDEASSAVVVDFRVHNPSDVDFVVRDVKIFLEKADGSTQEGSLIAKTDLSILLSYNRFLGRQYNSVLSLEDRIPARATLDRMVAARFELPVSAFDRAKGFRLHLEDLDGTEWDTEYRL